jgi:predicted amidohydrolase
MDQSSAYIEKMWVIRADVAGRTDKAMSYGSSEIVKPDGTATQSARQLGEDLLVAEIDSRRS